MSDAARKVSLFRNGRSQAIRIPKEFELPGTEATIRREGDVLMITPVRKRTLREVADSWDPAGEDFPDIEDFPPDPVDISDPVET